MFPIFLNFYKRFHPKTSFILKIDKSFRTIYHDQELIDYS